MRTVLYGSRPDGHAKVVAELAAEHDTLELVGMLDDFSQNAERTVRGLSVLGTGDDFQRIREEAGVAALLLAFGESRGRAEAVERAAAAGYELPALVHRTAVVCQSAHVGAGAQVLALAYIGPDARIGRGVLVNTGAVVEHDARVADGAVIAPAATLCGRVAVGSNATVGAGATVLPDVAIGAGATVAAGALVREDVPAAIVVAGVPARPMTAPP